MGLTLRKQHLQIEGRTGYVTLRSVPLEVA